MALTDTLPPLSRGQEEMIDFALDRRSSAWFVPPGYGKTRAWLEVIAETPGRTLIVAPMLVCINTWPRELVKWGFDSEFEMSFLHGKNKKLSKISDVTLINYEGIQWLVEETRGLGKFPFTAVIYDELSKLKNPLSKRFQAWDNIVQRFKYRNGGTGTPCGAHLKDLYGEMYVCDLGRSLGFGEPSIEADFERFLGTHFHHNPYLDTYEPFHDTLDTLLNRIYDRAISFDINDLDMPPLVHIPRVLALPDDVREQYARMQEQSAVEELDVSAMNAAVRAGKLRQLASGAVLDDTKERRYLHDVKGQALREIVDELQGEPVMIFFEFLSDYVTICKTLGQIVPALYGGTKTRDANNIVKDWNAGKLPFLALHPRSASYGLNLQDSGRALVWYTLSWSLEMVLQGIGRLWRQGQTRKVLNYFLLIEDTVDEKVYERVQNRQDTHDAVMKGLLG